MKQSTNYNLKVYEGSDLFNPLTVEAPNMESIDAAMFSNKNAGVQTATEVKSGTVHALTRTVTGASVIRFVATSQWTAGDTCTVDGTQVSTLLPNGETLPTGAWQINSNVLCILTGTLLTVFTTPPTGEAGDIDAKTLEGHPASYFAVAADTPAKSAGVSVQLSVNAWNASGSNFIQTVSVAGVTSAKNIVVAPAANSWDAAVEAQVRATAQGSSTVTFTASEKPSAALYMNVIVLG